MSYNFMQIKVSEICLKFGVSKSKTVTSVGHWIQVKYEDETKPDGKWRPCGDCRCLNLISVPD